MPPCLQPLALASFNKLVMLTHIGFFSGLDLAALPTESNDLFCKVDLVEGCDGTCLDLDGGGVEEEGDFSFLRCDEEVGGGRGGDFSFLQCDEEEGGGGRRRLLFYMGDKEL